MSSMKEYIQSVVGAVETLGYTFTDEFFNFDTLPASGSDKIYRIETKAIDVIGMSGNRVEKKKYFYLWFAYKLAGGSDRKLDTYNVIDAQEAVEDKVFQALSGIQVAVIKNKMSAIKSDYILVEFIGEIIYWRDLTA